ncbi:MAG: 3-hydroxylacyl-ACP dehydratase [Kiritimatiellae bacterium]|nr:3-hydroxylacyl-ACP dehydratase [Kiritimatiellia bacterium]
MTTSVPLEELLPHRPPMVLIDAVESFDAATKCLVARVTIGPDQLFCTSDGVPNWVAIEYMAQAAAALVGFYDKVTAPGAPARPGLLLGTRRLDLKLDRFEMGKTYYISAENVFSDDEAASFICSIQDAAGDTVATATLSAYRPPDIEQFIKEQVKT